MSLLIFGIFIALLSFSVNKFAGSKRHRWIHAGYATAFLLPVLVYLLTPRILGTFTDAGVGAGVAAVIFAVVTLITGFIFLCIGYTAREE